MPKQKIEGLCPICGELIEVQVIAYRDKPFINAKFYDVICWTCACVVSETGLHTPEEMADDGWKSKADQKLVKQSIKALARLTKKK